MPAQTINLKYKNRYAQLINEGEALYTGIIERKKTRTEHDYISNKDEVIPYTEYSMDTMRYEQWKTNCLTLFQQTVLLGGLIKQRVEFFNAAATTKPDVEQCLAILKGFSDDYEYGLLTANANRDILKESEHASHVVNAASLQPTNIYFTGNVAQLVVTKDQSTVNATSHFTGCNVQQAITKDVDSIPYSNKEHEEEPYTTMSVSAKEGLDELRIDQVSLKSFVCSNKVIMSLDDKVATVMGARLVTTDRSWSTLEAYLHYCRLHTISDVITALAGRKHQVVPFAREWLRGEKQETALPGIALFYLCYIIIAEQCSITVAYDYFEDMKIGDEHGDEQSIDLARRIVATYEKVSI